MTISLSGILSLIALSICSMVFGFSIGFEAETWLIAIAGITAGLAAVFSVAHLIIQQSTKVSSNYLQSRNRPRTH